MRYRSLGAIAVTAILALTLAATRLSPNAPATVATLTLSSHTRPTLHIGEAPSVRLRLPAPRFPADLTLRTASGRTVASWSLFGFSSLTVQLPSSAVSDESYVLSLRRAASPTVLTEYHFRVLKY
jgi:hypothetical protein